jgi:hypothetical protein
MIPVPAVLKQYAKAVIAVVGFVALVAGQVASGGVDAGVIGTALVGLLTTLGVIKTANAPQA